MGRMRRDQLRRRYARDERRCRDCWEARVPTATALKLCSACQERAQTVR